MASNTNIQEGVIGFDYIKALNVIEPKYLNKIFITYRGGNSDYVNNLSDWYRINNTNFLVNAYLDPNKNKLYVLSISKINEESMENTTEKMNNMSIGGARTPAKKHAKKKPGRPKVKEQTGTCLNNENFECDYNDVDEYGGKKKKPGRKNKTIHK